MIGRYARLLAAQLRASTLTLFQYRLDFLAEGLLEILWALTALVPLFVVFRTREAVADMDVEIVVNLQADEPEIDPANIDYLAGRRSKAIVGGRSRDRIFFVCGCRGKGELRPLAGLPRASRRRLVGRLLPRRLASRGLPSARRPWGLPSALEPPER